MKLLMPILLALLIPIEAMANENWERPDCSQYRGLSAEKECFLDFIMDDRARMRQEYKSLGLTYAYFANP